MTLANTSAKLIEDLLKETKKMQKSIMDLEISLYACEINLAAQKVETSHYRIAFKHLPYGIYLKDKDMKYLFCNDAFAQMINKRPEDIKGRTDRELFPQEIADYYSAGEQRVWYSGQAMQAEESHTVNGEERTFLASRRLIRDEERDITKLVGCLIDITEWKQLLLEQSGQMEVERLKNEVQRISTEQSKIAHILLAKVSDLQNIVASVQKYLGSFEEANQ
jgi:PAS domain S-box-containing protein